MVEHRAAGSDAGTETHTVEDLQTLSCAAGAMWLVDHIT